MQIKILFDKEARDKKLHTGWGVSFLVNDEVLFDTGEKGNWLIENMDSIGVEVDKIHKVVISHQHWDHTGGLWELLRRNKGGKVYICSGLNEEFKEKIKDFGGEVVETNDVTEIDRGIFVTGGIRGKYKGVDIVEQALVVRATTGLTVMTGCSHPGIVNMLEVVKQRFPSEKLHFVFGGFHLMDKDRREIKLIAERMKEMGVEKVGPTHCTGYEAQKVFKEVYADRFIFIKAGMEFEV